MRAPARLALTAVFVTVPVVLFAGTAQAATTAALWKMESASAATDSSGHGNNGSTTAITTVPGSSGNGYRFNGTSSVVTVPDRASLDPGSANIQITAHVRFTVVPSASVGDYDLIRKGLSGTAGGDWKMEIFPPSPGSSVAPAYCLFQDGTGRTAAIRDTRNLADGRWHTISCVKTATSISVVVDGATRSVAARLGSMANSSALTIGAKSGGGDQYRGDMDEVSIAIG